VSESWGLVRWGGGGGGRLGLGDRSPNGLRQSPFQRFGVFKPAPHAQGRARKDQAADSSWLRHHVVNREHRPPRVTEDVNLRKPQSPPKFGQFLDETLHTPEANVRRFVGSPGSELVVEEHGAFVRKYSETIQVVAGRAGPSMQQQQRSVSSATDDAVPNAAPLDIDISFARLEPRPTTPSGQDCNDDQAGDGPTFYQADLHDICYMLPNETEL